MTLKVPGSVSPEGYTREQAPLSGAPAEKIGWLPDQPDSSPPPEPVLPDRRSPLEDVHDLVASENPDEVAKVIGLSQKHGLSPVFTKANLEKISSFTPAPPGSVFDSIERNYPGTAKWLGDPRNMAVARDDLDAVQNVEGAVSDYGTAKTLYTSLISGLAKFNETLARAPGFIYDVAALPQNLISEIPGAPNLTVRAPEWLSNNPLARHYAGEAKAWAPPELHESVSTEIGRGNYRRAAVILASQVAANLPQQVGLILSTASGAAPAGLVAAGVMAGTDANQNAREQGIDPATGTANALFHGTVEGAFERLGVPAVFHAWEGAITRNWGKQVSREVFKDLGKTLAYAVSSEFYEESATSFAQDFSDWVTGVNPNAMSGIFQRALDAGLIGAASGATMTTPVAIGTTAARLQSVPVVSENHVDSVRAKADIGRRDAALTRDAYLNVGKSTEATKLQERLPEASRSHLETVTQGGPMEHVYVDTDAVDLLLQSKNENPTAKMQELGLLDKYTEAKQAGTPMQVPLAEWVDKTRGTELYQGLADDVKFDPKAQSVNEAAEEVKQAALKTEAAAKAAESTPSPEEKATSESLKKVQDAVESDLRAAGYSKKDARLQALLAADSFRIRAEEAHNGADPWELYQREGLKVARVDAAPPAAEAATVMNQPGALKGRWLEQSEFPMPSDVTVIHAKPEALGLTEPVNPNEKASGELMSTADDLARARFRGPHLNEHTKWTIDVASRGLGHVRHTAGDVSHSLATAHLDEILKHAVFFGTEPPLHGEPDITAHHIFYAPMRAGGKDYLVRVGVNETRQGKKLYEAAVIENEGPAGSLWGGTSEEALRHPAVSGSKLSIDEMRALINAVRSPKEPYFQGDTTPGVAPPFYSKLTRTIEDKMGTSATPEQVRGLIKDTKEEERKWSGIDEFLKGKEKVSKAELLEFLRANQLEVKEVTKKEGFDPERQKEIDALLVRRAELEEAFQKITADYPTVGDIARQPPHIKSQVENIQDQVEAIDNRIAEHKDLGRSDSRKFQQYTLPGGENYREVLFTLPEKPLTELPEGYSFHEGKGHPNNRWQIFGPDNKIHGFGATKEAALADMQRVSMKGEQYRSSHWDEPNVLAHVRLTDRTDAQGRRGLHAEEVQSDWHQAGRKSGYRNDINEAALQKVERRLIEVKAELEPLDKKLVAATGQIIDEGQPWHRARTIAVERGLWSEAEETKREALLREKDELVGKASQAKHGTVPDAPFRKTWHEFAMKRLIRMAAEGGYDFVSWSTGEQNAEHYDLAKSVRQVNYTPDTQYLTAVDHDGGNVIRETVPPDKLSDFIGKDAADKILNSPTKISDGIHVLRGDDLKVGGAGMRGFYDKILPDFMRKFGKKYGAQVGEAKIASAPSTGEWRLSFYNSDGEKADEGFNTKAAAEEYLSRLNHTAPGFARGAQIYRDASGDQTAVHSMDITPALREAALKEGFSLFQKDISEARGFFDPIRNFIGLLKNMNRSTWFHEMGHFWLEGMRRDVEMLRAKDPATLTEKQKAFLDRSEVVLKELGVSSFAEIGREHHEKWAKLTEAYIMRGEAPSVKLRQAFSAFKMWMVRIYQNFRGLGVQVSPEVAGVMDRLFATEEEIARAKSELEVRPLFSDPIAAGMNEKQAERYRQALSEAEDAAREELTERLMADYRQAQVAEYREQRAKLRSDIENEVSSRPVYKAIEMLRGSLEDGTPVRLNKAALVAAFGKDVLAKLPRPSVYSPTGNIHHDDAAQALGFTSGAALVDELTRAPKKESLIEAMTDEEMHRLHPDLLTDGGLPDAAVSALHNEKRAELLRLELEHIAENNLPLLKDAIRRVARKPLSQKVMREEAERTIGKKVSRDIRPQVYERAQVKARRKAGDELAKGDFNAAFQAKQDEALQLELHRAATAAQDAIEAGLQDFQKLRGRDDEVAKTRDVDLVNAARAILAQVGLSKTGKTAAGYLEQIRTYDPDTYATASSLVAAVGIQAQDHRDLTFDDFRAVHDSVMALWDLSKSVRQIEIDGKSADVEEIREAMTSRLLELGQGKKPPGLDRAVSQAEKTKMQLLGGRAALRRVESWADAIDGDGGERVFTKKLVQPTLESVTRYRTAKAGMLERVRSIVAPLAKDPQAHREILAPELGHTFKGKSELLGALLHSGNESNLSKLLRGRKWGGYTEDGILDSSRWNAFLQRAYREGLVTKADMDIVQAVWDVFDESKPQAQRAHKAMYGYYFDEITAQEIQTPFGTYRGGYFPAKADPFAVEAAAIREEKNAILGGQNSFAYPTTGRGFTKKRVEAYAAPLIMDLGYVAMALDGHLRFIHIEPQVKSAARIVMNPEFRAALRVVDPAAATSMLVPWLQRTATQRVTTSSPGLDGQLLDRVSRWLRTNTGRQAMFFNVTNALQQFTGIIISATKVAPRHLRNAVWDYARSPRETADLVAERSAFMKLRLQNQSFEMQGAIDAILRDDSRLEKFTAFAAKHTYFVQSAFQNIVDITTWAGAYNEAIEKGTEEKEAVRAADAAVRLTQGSTSPEDSSRFETGSHFARTFTMFFGYFNMIANLMGTEFTKVTRDMGLRQGAGRGLYVYTMAFMLPAVLSEAIVKAMSGKGFDEDDDGYLNDVLALFFGSQFRTATAMIPGVGQAANALANTMNKKPYDDRISTSPAIAMLERAAMAPVSTYKAVTSDGSKSKAIRDVLTLVGMASGLPTSALARPLGYLSDIDAGKTAASGPLDMARGLISGKGGKK